MTLQQCMDACTADDMCTAITTVAASSPGPGHCWLRTEVSIDECLTDTPYDTWVSSTAPSPKPSPVTTPSPPGPAPSKPWTVCESMGQCSTSLTKSWSVRPAELGPLVGDLSSLPTVGAHMYDAVHDRWQSSPPSFKGVQVTLRIIANFMHQLLSEDPFGTGFMTVPWVDFGSEGTTVVINQRQLAFVVANVLMGNTIAGVENGLSAALSRCSAGDASHNTFVYSLFSLLAVLSQELNGGDGSLLAGARPQAADDSWRERLRSSSLSAVDVCTVEGAPFAMSSACGKPEFMGGSAGGQRAEYQALTDIAGAVVGGGAQLCEIANSQDESLVQFYPETLAFAFFRGGGAMLPSPWTLLGARRYMKDLSGGTSANPPYRNMCGMLPDTDWLNEAILETSKSVQISGPDHAWSGPMAPSSFVAVASFAWWIPEPNGCEFDAARNNNCEAQRKYYDDDIRRWYQAYEPTMYDSVVHTAFRSTVRSIGTGPWGAGVWWGDSQMYFLKVWLATSLVGNVSLDYYSYSHFVENPGNQCFVRGGDACRKCLQEGQMDWMIFPDRCGSLSAQDMITKFRGQPARVLYDALGKVGAPPAQVFDTLGGAALGRSDASVGIQTSYNLFNQPAVIGRSVLPAARRGFGIALQHTSCEQAGLAPIYSNASCAEAGRALGLGVAVLSVPLEGDQCQVADASRSAVCTTETHVVHDARFEQVTGRPCNRANLENIDREDVCKMAALTLRFNAGSIEIDASVPLDLRTCFFERPSGVLLLGAPPADERVIRLCLSRPTHSFKRQPLCTGFEYTALSGRCALYRSSVEGSVPREGSVCIERGSEQ